MFTSFTSTHLFMNLYFIYFISYRRKSAIADYTTSHNSTTSNTIQTTTSSPPLPSIDGGGVDTIVRKTPHVVTPRVNLNHPLSISSSSHGNSTTWPGTATSSGGNNINFTEDSIQHNMLSSGQWFFFCQYLTVFAGVMF